ncbi:porin [Bradyrhizobium erythrophlei]|uniref:Outer membrane protein (Porin) n=1 Tax=Bradyrhizobium erythrophlei TaxID=1437360 RepID=A0A1M7TPX1_9BRAD|nr:porin [Bradyrhizobium erythrophlei]SHN72792.1 Outer membrane protein (porin) [Bradyrhizobium erythrophlei]
MKRTFISAAAILAFAATAAHADELTDIQAQAKQLREQNAAMTKRLADIEKRQKALEAQKSAVPTISPVDAMAADLPYKAAVKARPVENDDICIKGVCVYGNFDMGVAYFQHGNAFSPLAGFPQNAPMEKAGNGAQFGATPNMLSTSFIGLRGKQEIGDNLYAVFNLQTLFNPASGANANGIGAIVQNNGLGNANTLGTANAYGDSSKAGQMFNNAAYFGISSPTYGTLTMGRQSALSSDLVVNYDALSGSNMWSLITNEGATGGAGNTENRIFNNSFEYRLNIGPVRLAALTQLRDGNNSSIGNAFQGNIGFDYMGLSMDAVGGKIFQSVSFSGGPLSTAQVNAIAANQLGTLGPAGFAGTGTIACNLGCLPGTVSDNTNFQIAARYTIGPWKFYGGYEFINKSNPDNPLTAGANVLGGYALGFANNNNYVTDGHFDVFWAGVKYSITPALDIAASYYGFRQHFFTQGAAAGTGAGTLFANTPGGALANNGGFGATTAGQQAACAANSAIATNCAGGEDMFGIALDWRFARHVDFYAGVAYSQRNGGLAAAFVQSNQNGTLTGTNVKTTVSTFDPGIGLRYQF